MNTREFIVNASEFSKSYQILIKRIWPTSVLPQGWSKHDIEAAERRLGFRLPAVLRTFYTKFGHLESINKALHVLLDPQKLHLRSQYLVFYEMHQSTGWWGLAGYEVLGDPKVYVCYEPHEKRPHWYLQHDRLSDFFVTMFCWQATQGGAPYGGFADINRGTLRQIRKELPQMQLRGHKLGFEVYGNTGPILCVYRDVCVFQDEHRLTLAAAAATFQQLIEIEHRFKIRWDHMWPE